MPTNPIKPTEAKAAQPSPPNSGVPDKSGAKPPEKVSAGLAIPKVQSKPSPLKEQHRDNRGQPDYSPVQLVILNGAYKGKSLDLGLTVNEVMHSEIAEWEAQDGDGIRVGINFKRLAPREISLSLTYFSAIEDVSHLVENVKHLKEITDGEAKPPLLLLIQGALQATECVCTSVQDKYSEPHPGRKGLRRADVEIKLMLGGGKNSNYALGAPLVSTPLGDERARQTQAERQKQGLREITKTLFAPCLGEQGSAALEKLIEQDKLTDSSEIAKLDASAFVQASIAGLLPASALQQPALQEKLIRDLAAEMARSEDGIGQSINTRKFAQGLITGTLPEPNEALQQQLARTKPDFDLLLQAIVSQDLGETSQVFDRSKNPTAGERLTRLGSCGLSLRRIGVSGAVTPKKQVDPVTSIYFINDFIGNKKPSDAEIRQQFGDLSSAQIKALKNGAPYQNKEEFVKHNSQNSDGIVALKMFNNFAEKLPELPTNE